MSKKFFRRTAFAAAIALFATVMIFGTSAFAADKLVIISPHWEGIRKEFNRGFEDWYAKNDGGDVEITWLDQGGTSDDLRFIRAGFSRSPEGIDVDLFYGGGLDPYIELSDSGLLEPYEVPAEILAGMKQDLNGVPLYDKEYRWYGASLAGFGILYNRKLLDMYQLDAPAEWEELSQPELFGMVGSSDPRHSGSMHMMYEIILQTYGWERGWEVLISMGGNVRNFPKSSSQISKDLAVGEVAAGLSIDTYAFSAIEDAGADMLGFVLPQQATVITPDPIGILKGAPNREVAEAFIRFCLSPEGQKLWMYKKGAPGGPVESSLNKMSIMPAIYEQAAAPAITSWAILSQKSGSPGQLDSRLTNITVNPFLQEPGFTYDFEKGSLRWSLINDMVGAFIIDTHDALSEVWESAKDSPEKAKKIATVPLTEDEAMSLAKEKWGDAVARNEVVNDWLVKAQENYK